MASREVTWRMNEVVVDLAVGHVRCIRRLAQTARKNAKFLLSPEKTVQYTAKNAFQSAGIAVVKRRDSLPVDPQRQRFKVVKDDPNGKS